MFAFFVVIYSTSANDLEINLYAASSQTIIYESFILGAGQNVLQWLLQLVSAGDEKVIEAWNKNENNGTTTEWKSTEVIVQFAKLNMVRVSLHAFVAASLLLWAASVRKD
uniref:Uncharacterized protein n=1 Tax=Glossina pallidipes TaxID=7398 RepID=A0A1B0A597_GLOPL